MNYEDDFLVDLSESNTSLQEELQDELLTDILRSILTEREYLCIDKIVLQGYSADSVAKALGISKQAVNQCKNRGLKN